VLDTLSFSAIFFAFKEVNMPRILSRSDLRRSDLRRSDLRRKQEKRHSSFMSSFPSSSTTSYGANATWNESSASNATSSPNLADYSQQSRIRGQIGHGYISKDSFDRPPPKGREHMFQIVSTAPSAVATSCENSITSESLYTTSSAGGQSLSKTGSFLPRMPSSTGDWGQYVDVSGGRAASHTRTTRQKQPAWKKFFH